MAGTGKPPFPLPGEAAEFAEKIKITSPPVRLAIIDLPAKVDPLYAEIKRIMPGR